MKTYIEKFKVAKVNRSTNSDDDDDLLDSDGSDLTPRDTRAKPPQQPAPTHLNLSAIKPESKYDPVSSLCWDSTVNGRLRTRAGAHLPLALRAAGSGPLRMRTRCE